MRILSESTCKAIYRRTSGRLVTIIIVILAVLAGTAAGFEQYSTVAEAARAEIVQTVEETE